MPRRGRPRHESHIMQKILCLIFLVTAIAAGARQISPDEAAAIASDFLNSPSILRSSERVAVQRVQSPNHQADAPFYVFNADDSHGFVIISGDDRTSKIIGYSRSRAFDFDNLPPQLAAILDKYAERIKTLPASASVDSSWSATSDAPASTDGILLKTADWGQGYPYNLLCPTYNGVNAPTGCVATAMAIIMRYHNWPNRGRSQHSYAWENQPYYFDYNSTTFDWSQMPLEYVENEFSSIQGNEVAKLMFAAGNSVNMMYGETESGALAIEIPYNMYRFFRYNIPSFIYKDGGCPDNKAYTDEEWLELIKEQINANNPLIYSYTGHMYVVDGYDAEGLVHVNWGWDGVANGYFAINQMGIAEAMICSITPDFNEDDTFESVILSDGSLSNGAQIYGCALNMNTTDIIPNEEYEVAYTCITQTRKEFGIYHVALALTDEDGNIKEILTDPMLYDGYSAEDNGTVSGLNGGWGIKIEHEVESTDLIMCVIKKADEPDNCYHPIKTPSHIKPYLKAHGNTPLYCTVPLKVDDSIFVTRVTPVSGYANIGNNKIIDQNVTELSYLANSALILYATANTGIPVIKLGDLNISKVENYKYNRSVYASIRTYNPSEVSISTLPFDEMVDLSITVDREGNLHSYINSMDYEKIKSLKISGLLNIDDFEFINVNLPHLQSLDLSAATIIPNIIDFRCVVYLNWLKELILPSNLHAIGDEAFYFPSYGCLEVMDIPASVESISGYAFAMSSIDTFVVHTMDPIDLDTPEETFKYIHDGIVLYVPRGSKSKYSTADGWKNFQHIIEYDDDWRDERKEQYLSFTIEDKGDKVIANCRAESDDYGMRNAIDVFVVKGSELVDVCSYYYGGSRDCNIELKIKSDSNGIVVLEGRKEGDGHYAAAKPVQCIIRIHNGTVVAAGDVDDNGAVDGMDLNMMISGILSTDTSTLTSAAADMNGDGSIDGLDINMLITNIINTQK